MPNKLGQSLPLEQVRGILCARLRLRRGEIAQAALARVYAVAGLAEDADPEYAEGLRAAVSAALDYALAALERGEERAPPIPAILLTQARLAARNRIRLDTVLRRYFVGYTLLGDFLIGEAEEGGLLRGAGLKRLLRGQAALFDNLIAAVTGEYTREVAGRLGSTRERRAERVKRLLAGDLVDASDLAYDFDFHHLGAIAVGAEAEAAVRCLAKALDRRLLLVRPGEDTVWAWLGARRGLGHDELERQVASNWPAQVALAVGEPAPGLTGWRLTHQQARAALPIALRGPQSQVRYGDVAVLASMLQDDLLVASLRELYLEPLSTERDRGDVLRQTLRAYFAAERNGASTAVAMGVSRQTVNNRIRAIEQRLGRPLTACASEVEAALRLEDLSHLTMITADEM